MLKLPVHPRLGKVLGVAGRWAQRFGSTHLGSEHVLLALAEVDGPAREVLTDAGASVEVLRDAVLASLPESQRKLFAPTDEEALQDLGIDVEAIRKELAEEFGVRLPLGRGLSLTTALT
ncbi:MAG TPA: Clp protease N-terminal domain-containing protein, partial [Actinomycetota bacterium]|nr:Clp protease N-terminal domain-containing protein [Actinomycetota bacterium]